MKLARRQFLHLAAGAAALPAFAASLGRKPIRRGRCALLLLSPLGAQMTSLRACLVSGYPSGLDNRLLSRTDRALVAQSAPKLS